MRILGAVVVSAFLLSCAAGASGRRFRDLPADERDAMDRCAPAIRHYGACAPQQDRIGVQQDACMEQLAKRYAMLRDAAARKDLLVESGCPADTLAVAPQE